MDANKLFTKFAVEKIWNKLKQHDKAMNSVLLILLPSNWILQDGKYVNTVQYSGFKSSDKLTVDLYDDGNLADLQLTEYEHYIDGFEIIDGALVAIASVKPTQTMTVVVKGGFQANESEVGDLSVIEDELNVLGNRPVNNNLLINSNFANPVNQRGYVSGTSQSAMVDKEVYWIDRWKFWNGSATLKEDGISFSVDSASSVISVTQHIELKPSQCLNKKFTFSVSIDGVIYSKTFTVTNIRQEISFYGTSSMLVQSYDDYLMATLYISKDFENKSVNWVKFEEGDYATPYVPRHYAEELQLCQRYFKYINVFAGSTLYSLDSNLVIFHIDCGSLMREIPTVNFNTCAVFKNGNFVNGFSFELFEARNNLDKCVIGVVGTKSSHGLALSNLITLGNSIVLDAEL